MRIAPLLLPPCAFACAGERTEAPAAPAVSDVPRWAQEAIWYQVFVERFRNGDAANDPTLHDMDGAWPHLRPEGWAPTPWGHDWYAQEPWAAASGEGFYTTVQLRRYGGDLQGVLDRLGDLQELGVTALYLNPINDAPSLHKYDARTYRHVDRNFGPDPSGDEVRIAGEDPVDPATWVITSADSLFLALVGEVHQRGMRIIIFDPVTVIDRSTYMDATVPAEGIPYVIAGGEVVVDRGELTAARPGRAMRAPIK